MKKSRFFIFLGVLSVIFGLIWYTVWAQFIAPLYLSRFAELSWLFIFVGTYVFQFIRWVQFRSENPSNLSVSVNYFIFGLFIYLFLLSAGVIALDIFIGLDFYRWQISFWGGVFAFSLNIAGMVTALRGPQVVHQKISRGAGAKSFRIVQISDLHIGPLIKTKYVQMVVDKINALHPDVIVLTGDIGDGSARSLASEMAPLRGLQSRLGSYYVTGNHEYYWGVESWLEELQKIGVKSILNTGEVLDSDLGIYLAGVPDFAVNHLDSVTDRTSYPFASPSAEAAIAALGPEKISRYFKILLAHQPKFYTFAKSVGFDLMLCGHTHRGQFFPFNFLVGLFNPFSHGLHRSGHLQIYVNAGTGFWGPPLRLGVPAEITCIDIS